MNAKSRVALNKLEGLLADLHILQRRNTAVSRSFNLSKIRSADYTDLWKMYYQENWFDFQFKDLSLIYFDDSNKESFSYIYMGCPYDCISEEDYYQLCDGLYSTYDDYISTCPVVNNVTYIRYDNSPDQYNEGLHPAHHIHWGFNQKNRIGISYELNFYAFVALIIRQCYPDKWEMVINNPSKYKYLYESKKLLTKISNEYYNNHDQIGDYYFI